MKMYLWILVILVVGYILGTKFPGFGQSLLSKVGL